MKSSKTILLLFFIFSFASIVNGNNATLDSANAAYASSKYDKAIILYESILKSGQVAPEVYFNLGNAYYKSNNIGSAILNYERAKKLAPDDDDITVNLKLANQKTEDKIESAPQLFLTTWKNGIVDLMDEKSWSLLCVLMVVISLVLFAVYIFTPLRGLKQVGFFGGAVFIIISVIVFFLAKHKYTQTITSSEAIITSPTVTVMGSPNEKGTKLFILHEGTKVGINEDDGEWMEIKIANGNVGWVQSKTITPI